MARPRWPCWNRGVAGAHWVEGGRTIEAHIPRDRFEPRALAKGRAGVCPAHDVRVLAEPA